MKNLSKLLLLTTLLLESCAENTTVPEPAVIEQDPIGQEPVDFTVTDTREPFAVINDRGFEAMLIYSDIDSDNQINGKVSLADLEKVITLTNQNITKVQMEKRAYLRKVYNEIPEVKSFDEVRLLSNLKELGTYGGEHLDLSHNLDLEEIQMFMPAIKTINLKNLKKLKRIDFYPAAGVGYWPDSYLENIENFKEIDVSDNIALEVFKYYASAATLDVSKNVNLRELYLTSKAYEDTVLDLSNNTLLEVLDCSGLPSVKEIWVSNEVMDKIMESPLNWKKPENAAWKINTW